MRFAICNETFEGWDFRRTVEFVKATGYDGLELAPFTLADSVTDISSERRTELKKIAADNGIELTGLHWLLVKPPGLHLTHPDKSIRGKTIDYLKHLIDFAGDVDAKFLVFGSPNQRKILPGVTREQGWQYAIEGFAACGDTAAKRGVTFCLEALPESLTNILNTNAEVIRMVRDINHPSIRMMVDVKSMCAESISIPDNIRNSREFFRYVHANDANMRGPGFGDVDFKPILRTLNEVGYTGWVSVEVFDYKPDPETIARESLRYLRESLP